MGALARDLRYGLRILALSPGFAAAAILSLAIGIGANTAMFSVTNALLLRPLPYRDAARLAILWNRSPGLGILQDWFSTAQYFDVKTGHPGFEQVAIAIGGNSNLTGDGDPERVGVIRASSNLLPMFGARAAAGRLLVPGEDVPGRPPTAILGFGIWSRRFGADPRVIGRSVTLNGQTYQIVGALPASFSLPREVLPTLGGAEEADFVLPLPLDAAARNDRNHEDYNLVGKLRPGVPAEQAQAAMDALTARLRRDFPEIYPPNGGLTFSIVPLREQVVGSVRQTLLILLGAVGLVLLVACANVANLLLARALARQKEIAVRAAFGADPGRLRRQLHTESLLLSAAGAFAGILLARWSLGWVRTLGLDSIPRVQAIAIDWRVLGFTLAISALTGILFGLAPAWRVSRVDLNGALKAGGRGASAGAIWSRGHRLRRLLVVAELALSVVLLIGAGLLIRSLARIGGVAPGFHARDVLTFSLTMTGRRYNGAQEVVSAYRSLWERLDRLPGAVAAGGITALPLTRTFAWTPVLIEGRTPPPGEKFINADERVVAGRYFEAMQVPLRTGRFFDERDTPANPRVTIVDENFARQFWPGRSPLGKRIQFGLLSKPTWLTIVGVVGQVKQDSLDSSPRIAFYVPHTQSSARALTVVVRSRTEPAALAAAAKAAVHEIDPGLPLYAVRTMPQLVSESLARRRFTTLLLTVFAALALVLAALGIYGVMAYLVSQGTREIGIRIALGATARGIQAMVMSQGLRLALAGAAAGLAGALAFTRFLGALLYDVAATDVVTFVAIPLVLVTAALLATWIPSRRAARVDPMISLRWE